MALRTGEDRRKAARVKFRISDKLEIRYKFLSHMEEFQCPTVFSGGVLNLSKGGALFVGPIPGPEWLPQLGQGLVLIGLNILVPDREKPLKVLSSLRWCRPAPPGFSKFGSGPHYELGVRFEQLEGAHETALQKFLIGHQLRTNKYRKSDAFDAGAL
ncbi:MAG: PilZ domain-containing protein [Planctomycetota bacterium]|nr:MAG: PilZ domain-containing protein [Planctomycetota bacterium]